MIPPINGMHLEPTNICTLKCPGCARTRFIDQWPHHWKNHSVDVATLIRFLDIDLSGLHFYLCGNYGDPIYHPDLAGLVQEFKNKGCKITITTNGSYRTSDWWQNLTDRLDNQDQIIFSIDGLPDNFTKYRINADWSSINDAIAICVASDVQTVWKFIPFAYNQQDTESVQRLSTALGIDQFQLDRSARFDEKTMVYLPATNLVSNLKISQDQWKNGHQTGIGPKCSLGQQHFVSAQGFYSPCCFIADHRFYQKTIFGKQKNQFDIRNQTLSQLYEEIQVQEFYLGLEVDPPGVCTYSCPKMD